MDIGTENIKRLDVSVIIVNYRTPDYTIKAIESVVRNCPGLSREIIVVDNASNDDSIKRILSCWRDNIILIQNQENVGFAKANNQGMQIARGRYYFLLNSDAEVLKNGIEQMIKYANEYPDIGILGCTVLSADGHQQFSCWKKYTVWYLFLRALYLYRIIPDGWLGNVNLNQYGRPVNNTNVEVVSGCVMLVRRDAVDRVGMFDERFFMYCEDMDWCIRMNQSGYRVHFQAEPRIIHYGGATSASMLSKMSIEQSRSTLQYFQKYCGRNVAYLANTMFCIFYLLRLPYWFIKHLFDRKNNLSSKKYKAYYAAVKWHAAQMLSFDLKY